jgi:hypothetical protein
LAVRVGAGDPADVCALTFADAGDEKRHRLGRSLGRRLRLLRE